MKRRGYGFIRILALMSGMLAALSGCTAENAPAASSMQRPTYSLNGTYDANGVEPPPNNGNQNFGMRH